MVAKFLLLLVAILAASCAAPTPPPSAKLTWDRQGRAYVTTQAADRTLNMVRVPDADVKLAHPRPKRTQLNRITL